MYVDSWQEEIYPQVNRFAIPLDDLPSGNRVGTSPPMKIERSDDSIRLTEIRRRRLKQLRDEMFGGSNKDLSNAIERQPSYVSSVINGKKGIAEELCLDVERRLGLVGGWMSQQDGGPPMVTPKKTLNADFLFRCTEVVGARFRAKARPTLQEIQMACYLYEMFQANADATTDAQMTLFIDQWLEFAKRSITHSP